jgi:NADH-quinone oxidoreductase subunit L
MTTALGASAYAAGIFHLMTHAFFKALLFLAAGSVIVALHHEQDIRRMGGLRKYMPLTYWTSLIGSLALIGFPGFSGFFSKDALIESVALSSVPGSEYALVCLTLGVFVTALYAFRMFFLVFHGNERLDEDARHHVHESPWVITVPLVLLAVPSAIIGWPTIGPVLFGEYFNGAIFVADRHDVLGELGREFDGPGAFLLHGMAGLPLLLSLAGVAVAWYAYLYNPALPEQVRRRFSIPYKVLANKYYFDEFNEKILAGAGRALGGVLWRIGDVAVIDGAAVNGTGRLVGWAAGVIRQMQTGYLYHYAFAMVIGLATIVGWILIGSS